MLHILDYPKSVNCETDITNAFKKLLLSCTVKMNREMNCWEVVYTFEKPVLNSCEKLRHRDILFTYDNKAMMVYTGGKKKADLAEKILSDWEGMIKMYKHAKDVDGMLKGIFDADEPIMIFCMVNQVLFRILYSCHTHILRGRNKMI